MDRTNHCLIAGAATADITPPGNPFLHGYPHVQRLATGVHDALLAQALYLDNGQSRALFIANDIVFVTKSNVARIRAEIAARTSLKPSEIMVTATHTHSGPVTTKSLAERGDPLVPEADPRYLRMMEDGMIDAGCRAVQQAQPAEAGLAVAEAVVGTNRHDPAGPADRQVPVLAVRPKGGGRHIAIMLISSMHPTVLHEDSTLISGDFPALARLHLQSNALGQSCPVLCHTGPSGNQSPRHVVNGNTFEEAQRLGQVLSVAVQGVLSRIVYASNLDLRSLSTCVDLPRKSFPSVAQAQTGLEAARARLSRLEQEAAPRAIVRTAECDLFGAEEILQLAMAASDGSLDAAFASCLPAEIQVLGVGPWRFIGWPGEHFVEYALEIKRQARDAYVISLANGVLQGYVATPDAVGYEASNGIIAPEAGAVLVRETLSMLSRLAEVRQ